MAKQIGVNSMRISISWVRLFPSGDVGDINQQGLDFYNDVIDTMIDSDIEPFVTLWHFELPWVFSEDKGDKASFLDPGMIDRFVEFSDFCF